MRFTSLFVLASLAVSSFASTVADVQADIADISSKTTALDNSINAFANPGGTLTQALTIHNNAVALGSSLDHGTTDANAVAPLPISEADGRSILTNLEALEPTIDDALDGIIARKDAFVALPLGGIPALVKQDLTNLNASTSAFEAALIVNAPADLVAEATALKSRIDAKFASAIAAYAAF
ncbi:putative hydrophobic surface binding protein [Lyophyllum shimeji]|uniref:Hydrophobic surface binding protein n=1 Tax=Lyophyllum shimeji TaxID=47721 RepID=A0A9P3PM70_LYOSH|nr:putative hydrophobic surface binding protein [Lyophyllum shimeji]